MMLLATGALSGCRNRAYSELYVENMAAEVRDLEDQLYEYDHEYRALEQDIANLKQENARLRAAAGDRDGSSRSMNNPGGSFNFQRRGTAPDSPQSAEPEGDVADDPQSILGVPDVTMPPSAEPTSPAPADPRPSGVDEGDEEFNLDSLLPPTIEPGEPIPPPLPVVTDASSGARPNDPPKKDLEQSRIKLPAQLVSSQTSPQATTKTKAEKVTDTRVVEIAFHPSLSRVANLDSRPEEDGLYLVLQPRNVLGQMVPVAAELSVVVLDPALEGDAAKIGRWNYSTSEVQTKLQPIGSSQGVHLTLPWTGTKPSADRVIVFARYTFPDRRQVVGQKEIFVDANSGPKSVWAPRAPSSNRVVSAGHPANRPRPPASGPTNVVRPASGTTRAEPAPPPLPAGRF